MDASDIDSSKIIIDIPIKEAKKKVFNCFYIFILEKPGTIHHSWNFTTKFCAVRMRKSIINHSEDEESLMEEIETFI